MFSDILQKYSSVNTRYGTDKQISHSYEKIYNDLFSKYKDSCKAILEIGFDGGFSLQSYYEYFTNATVYGIDIEDNRHAVVKENKNLQICIGDAKQNDIIHHFSKEFDIIVEDASHLPEDQIQHFKDYSSFVKPGGIYIIEDIHEDHFKNVLFNTVMFANQHNFTYQVYDLRHIKNRFDDIMIVFFKKN